MTGVQAAIAYVNGSFMPVAEAKVSVLDRGFIFGDGVYEIIPVYGRRLFRFPEHMARLDRSLAKLRIVNPHGREEWLERCRALIAAQPQDDQLLYVQVTRGVALRDHAMPVVLLVKAVEEGMTLKAAAAAFSVSPATAHRQLEHKDDQQHDQDDQRHSPNPDIHHCLLWNAPTK